MFWPGRLLPDRFTGNKGIDLGNSGFGKHQATSASGMPEWIPSRKRAPTPGKVTRQEKLQKVALPTHTQSRIIA